MEQIHTLNANEIRHLVVEFMNHNKPKEGRLVGIIAFNRAPLDPLETAHGIITHPGYMEMDRRTKDWAWNVIQCDLEG